MTKTLHNNSIPANWPQLFSTSAVSYVNSDLLHTNINNPTSFNKPPSQRETMSSPPATHSTSLTSQQESINDDIPPSSSDDASN